jgi:hypothetical protein
MTGVCSLFLSGNSWVSRYGGMVWLFIAGKINETHQTGWAILFPMAIFDYFGAIMSCHNLPRNI